MRIRTTLMIAALAVGGAACKRSNRHRGDHHESTTTAKPIETLPAPLVEPLATPTREPVKRLDKEALVAKYKDCVTFINTAQLDVFERECVGKNFVAHHMDGMDVRGGDVVVTMFQAMQRGFPDFKLTPQLIAVSGRNILAVHLLSGTHDGPLAVPLAPAIPKTGNRVGMLFFHRLVIDDENKAVEEFTYSDPLTMLGQLGKLPKGTDKTRSTITLSWPNAPIIAITEDSETERTNLEIFNKAGAAFNAHDADAMGAYWAVDGFESDHVMATDAKGRAAIVKMTKDFMREFPDVRAEPTHLYATGDYVISLGRVTGTNKANKTIDIHFAEIAKLVDGKLTALWRFENGMAMALQLGSMGPHDVAPNVQEPTAPQARDLPTPAPQAETP